MPRNLATPTVQETGGARRATDGARRAVVVIGSHRSGLSPVARLLMLLGLDGPTNLWDSDSAEAAAHWEPASIVRLNDELFSSISSSWDEVGALSESWARSPVAASFHDRGVELVRAEYGESPAFVLKDPRVSRLLPLWRSALRASGADPSFVISVRNPLEVAASLKASDGITPGRALLVWLRNTLASELETRGDRRVFVSYEQLLRDWRAVSEQISTGLEIAWPKLTDRSTVEIERFISSALRHHAFDRSELEARADIPDCVKSTFAVLEEAASSGSDPQPEELDAARELLRQADLVFGSVVAETKLELESSDQALETLREGTDNIEAELEALRAEGSDKEAELETLQAQADAREKELAALRVKDAELETVKAQAEATHAELEGMRIAVSKARQQAENARKEAQERDQRIEQLSRELRSRDDWIRNIESSRSWRITRPLRAVGVGVRRLLRRPVAQPEPPATSTAGSGADTAPGPARPPEDEAARRPGPSPNRGISAGNGRGTESPEALIAWIRHIESSRSWRITRPLRAVGAGGRRLLGRPVVQPDPPPVSQATAGAAEPDGAQQLK